MIETISNLKQIKETLKSIGLRPTIQRIRVLKTLYKYRYKHPTVEMIYDELKDELPVISMTTVYNTMNVMVNKKMIQALTITGSDIHYDPNAESHHHFYCNRCHQIYDIDLKCPLCARKGRKIQGHRIEEMHGYFKGICKNCLKKKKGGKNA
ncbi:MAG: transcriptional repressor [candidate division WOR-3 bacterium]|nr:transcriptional repressor [candidate division WOR-3 bacterium]